MVKHTHKNIHDDQLELIQFDGKMIGVVRICNFDKYRPKNYLPWIQCEG